MHILEPFVHKNGLSVHESSGHYIQHRRAVRGRLEEYFLHGRPVRELGREQGWPLLARGVRHLWQQCAQIRVVREVRGAR